MISRIERRVTEEGFAVLCVSGRLRGQQVETLRDLLAQENGEVAIDLKHVLLVDDEAMKRLPFAKVRDSNSGIVRPIYVSRSSGR